MTSPGQLDDDDDFGGDFASTHGTKTSGNKRSFGDLEDDEDGIFGSKKGRSKGEETAPGVATGMILSLRESLQDSKDTLALCENELEAAKSEIQKWKSAFQNERILPAGKSLEPKLVIDYIQTLKASEKSLKEQLEISKRKEASCIVQYAKREQEMAELKSAVRDLKVQLKPPSMQARRLLLDPAIHEEFICLKNLIEEKDKKIKELQDNIAAVSFTPQSKMGKMLMAKCRTLQEENEEIGHQAAEGKMHELAMKLSLQKSQNAELRNLLEGLYKRMDALANDVERSNETVLFLQDKLGEKEKDVERLKLELPHQMTSVEDEKSDLADVKPYLADDSEKVADLADEKKEIQESLVK